MIVLFRRSLVFSLAASLALALMMKLAAAQQTPTTVGVGISAPDESQAIAQEAYLYLYPLVLMDLTRKQLTNLDPKTNPMGGPANAFTHIREFPTAEMRSVVRPNFDTLYSSAWLDLTNGPLIVSTADTGGRYFLLPMMDMWTDVFAVPGKRTNGTGAADFAVVPPGWNGNLPQGVERIDAPTPHVWIIGRTQTDGVRDYDTVHKIQDGYKVTPLADWGKPPVKVEQKIDPSIDTKTEPLRQVAEMPAVEFFKYGAELMKENPPHATDWSTIARLKRIGLEPGKSFDATKVSAAALAGGIADAKKLIADTAPTIAHRVNGWQMNTDTMGVYGNFYLKRAIIALAGLGANQVDDAIYPLNVADVDGKPVTAENKYVLRFSKDELPPVNAFWSLTMYDAEGYQVANPINRFAIGDRDALKFNPDGSLDLYVQTDSPGPDRESNWLPAPKGPFNLTMRLYSPRSEALTGKWNPPPVVKAQPTLGLSAQ
jgi:hypothetical protein